MASGADGGVVADFAVPAKVSGLRLDVLAELSEAPDPGGRADQEAPQDPYWRLDEHLGRSDAHDVLRPACVLIHKVPSDKSVQGYRPRLRRWHNATVDTQPQQYVLHQKFTAMVNRYELRPLLADGSEGPLVAMAQQKRLAFKEEVTFYSDEARTQPVFSFKARKRLDLAATYDVMDAGGQPIGEFRKDFGKSLLRSTWHLSTPDGLTSIGQERNAAVAVVRRFIDIPFLLFHFDFTAPDGQIIMSSERKRSLRDRYVVSMPAQSNGWQLDWRVGAAMAVALDALQGR